MTNEERAKITQEGLECPEPKDLKEKAIHQFMVSRANSSFSWAEAEAVWNEIQDMEFSRSILSLFDAGQIYITGITNDNEIVWGKLSVT